MLDNAVSCGRYSPSPTGRLHLGNLRTALLAWLQCRLSDGQFILRIDDLDRARNISGSLEQIIGDLYWLGLDWDEGPDVGGFNGPYLQSQRLDIYEQAFYRLQKSGYIFPCKCSRKDIAMSLNAPHQDQLLNIYPGTCRPSVTHLQIKSIESQVFIEGEYAWRYAVGNESIKFNDNINGSQQLDLQLSVGDFVVKRRDGLYAYQLTSIVDDEVMGVTDIVRGEDLMDSTHRQLALVGALNFKVPKFWHVPLLFDRDNKRMSKRDGSDSLIQWQEQSKTAEQLVGYFAYSSGLIDNNKSLSCVELLQSLNLGLYSQKLRANQVSLSD